MTRLGEGPGLDERRHGTDRREDDPVTLLGAAFRFANKQPPVTLIALTLIAFLVWLYVTQFRVIAEELHDHTTSSAWYQRQSCISLAVLAGSPPALCEPAADTRDSRDRHE